MADWPHAAARLSAAMGARAIRPEDGKAGLTIPLRPNINHEGTVFGGSLNALGPADGRRLGPEPPAPGRIRSWGRAWGWGRF